MAWMYILECSDKSFYVGSTTNLERRLAEHKKGFRGNYTSKRLPIRLVYCEEYQNIRDAYLREKQVQGWGRRKRMALIKRAYDDLPVLSGRSKKAKKKSG